jgi:hypothetical protein
MISCSRSIPLEGDYALVLVQRGTGLTASIRVGPLDTLGPIEVDGEDLDFLVRPGDRTVGFDDRMSVQLSATRALVVVDDETFSVCRRTFVSGLMVFIAAVRRDDPITPRKSVDEIWQRVKRRRPTATRIEDQFGRRIY